MQYAVRIHLDIFFAVMRDCTRVVIFHLVPEEHKEKYIKKERRRRRKI